MTQWVTIHVGSRNFMLVRLHSQGAGGEPEGLRVERVTIIQFHAVVVREQETIAGQHAPAIRGGLPDSIVSGALHEAPKCLNGGLRSASFLSKRGHRCQRSSQKNRSETISSRHLLNSPSLVSSSELCKLIAD